ncbi:MAG: 4-oxalocrotonate decarboxylase [Archaeoglobi archaeon]|nr:4-oxalocrotonate decarboxylase [Candidatus Mnemosynella bozhongmuii]
MIAEEKIKEIAEKLERCELEAEETEKITEEIEISVEEAYEIQREIRRRKESKGHRIIGYKIGLTSRAKMRQMGIDTPIFGFLADYFLVPNGGEIPLKELIHPKVEPEIAFLIGEDLEGPLSSPLEVLKATEMVMPALEIIDSRYRDFRFDLPSVIADNCSSSRFVIGPGKSTEHIDLSSLGVVFEKNGEIIGTSTGASVLGNPLNAVFLLVNHLSKSSEILRKGSIVLSGALSEAVRAEKGDFFRITSSVGSASVRFI